ncbi:MAG: T9SS type A sorting domain-containing protein [Bacteroidota bacterium]|nr:T9SS type A sorting domain-containing protein [Bacteroidota bacterium]
MNNWTITGDSPLNSITGIVTHPQNITVNSGDLAILNVFATGANLAYLWNTNQTSSNIIIKEPGIYTVTVTGSCGTLVTSATIDGLTMSSASISGIVSLGDITTITSPITIAIIGSGFMQGITVSINGLSMMVGSVSQTAIVVMLPAGVIKSQSLIVQVTNPGQVKSSNYTVTFTDYPISSLESFKTQNSIFTLYPNPTSGSFTIQGFDKLSQTNSVEVYNAQGALVYSQKLESKNTVVNAALTKGIYVVKMGTEVKKLVVE